jgi:hypothetical protein
MHEGKKLRDDATQAVLSDVDFLIGLGIYPPQVTQVAFELRSKGYPVGDQLPLTLEDALQLFSELGINP